MSFTSCSCLFATFVKPQNWLLPLITNLDFAAEKYISLENDNQNLPDTQKKKKKSRKKTNEQKSRIL